MVKVFLIGLPECHTGDPLPSRQFEDLAVEQLFAMIMLVKASSSH